MSVYSQSAINDYMGKSIESLCADNQQEAADLLNILSTDALRYHKIMGTAPCAGTDVFYYSIEQRTLLLSVLDSIIASPLIHDIRKKQANYLYGGLVCRMTFLETINAIRRASENPMPTPKEAEEKVDNAKD